MSILDDYPDKLVSHWRSMIEAEPGMWRAGYYPSPWGWAWDSTGERSKFALHLRLERVEKKLDLLLERVDPLGTTQPIRSTLPARSTTVSVQTAVNALHARITEDSDAPQS